MRPSPAQRFSPRARVAVHGWILVETLVALMILSVGVVAVNQALQDALLTRAMARDFTQARFLLEQVVSDLELQPQLVEGTAKSGGFGEDFERFAYHYEVSRVNLPAPELPPAARGMVVQPLQLPVSYLGKIRVTVSWTRAGRTFERVLETLIAPEKLYIGQTDEATEPPEER